MKDNKIDHLFREKLNGHSKSPSPMAWEKLNDQLSQKEKKKGFVWWHKAAVLVLICFSGFLIMNRSNLEHTEQLVSQEIETGQDENPVLTQQHLRKTADHESEKPTETVEEATSLAETLKPIAPQDDSKSIKLEHEINPRVSVEKVALGQYLAANAEPISAQTEGKTAFDAEEPAKGQVEESEEKQSRPPITIEFRSGKKEREQTLIAAKEDLDIDQSFTFKKLIAKVKDVKEGEIGLAELRQAKDDLFAFDTDKENANSSSK